VLEAPVLEPVEGVLLVLVVEAAESVFVVVLDDELSLVGLLLAGSAFLAPPPELL
jgi:hypothetical protein